METLQIDRPVLVGRCRRCGKLFEAKRRTRIYCSRSCAELASRARRLARRTTC